MITRQTHRELKERQNGVLKGPGKPLHIHRIPGDLGKPVTKEAAAAVLSGRVHRSELKTDSAAGWGGKGARGKMKAG